MKIRFVVARECILGYVIPQLPDSIQILAHSVIKGSPFDGNPCPGSYPYTEKETRPATIRDFKEFRVNHESYTKNPERYEPIPE